MPTVRIPIGHPTDSVFSAVMNKFGHYLLTTYKTSGPIPTAMYGVTLLADISAALGYDILRLLSVCKNLMLDGDFGLVVNTDGVDREIPIEFNILLNGYIMTEKIPIDFSAVNEKSKAFFIFNFDNEDDALLFKLSCDM